MPEAPATAKKEGKYSAAGKLLVDSKLISAAQLEHALSEQKEKALRLGELVVNLGFASEADVLKAFNDHYPVRLTRLNERRSLIPRGLVATLMARVRGMRVSIKAKLSVAIIFILLLTIFILSFVILTRQRQNLYLQTVQTGKVSLGYFVSNAKIPLLNGEVLALNRLIKEAGSVEGLVYATITDRDGTIMAHTDPTQLRKKLALPQHPRELTKEGTYTYFTYMNEKGQHVLNMASPVTLQDKVLGEVNVGVSLDFISQQIRQETLTVLLLSSGIIALGIAIAVFMGIGFSRPISQLVVGAREIGQGNLKYKIPAGSNDELGDLGTAFNYMSGELWKKQMMQESFGKYVGSDIVQMILANPESPWLKGTRSTATVMFTDIRGFTHFSESREPEAVVEALNQYFEIATRVILEYGGYVDKFIGDAVMGVFGVPVESTVHAQSAVGAALAMQKEFMAAAQASGNPVLAHVGIGINTGVLVSGNLGSQAKMEYTVIGDTVNTASRLNGLAQSGEVVISAATLEPIRALAEVEEMEPQMVKGKSEPVQVFKVLSMKEGDSHAPGSARPQQAAV
jgi:adenylate cyclase